MAVNRVIELYASAARTATSNVEFTKQSGDEARALIIVIDVTVDPASAISTPTIDAFDDASGKWHNILTASAINSVSTVVLRVGEFLVAAANLTVRQPISRTMRLVLTHTDGDSITYSVVAEIIK